jgi:hypothetical protein
MRSWQRVGVAGALVAAVGVATLGCGGPMGGGSSQPSAAGSGDINTDTVAADQVVLKVSGMT